MKLNFNSRLEDNVVQDLPFMPVSELNNLCAAELVDVKVVMYEQPLKTKEGKESRHEYKGVTIPQLEFTFRQLPMFDVTGTRIYRHIERVNGSIQNGKRMPEDTIVKIYNGQFDRIKHIFDAFKLSTTFKPLASLPDIDPYAPVEERAPMFTEYFSIWANAFNQGINDEPIYTKEPVLIKLVANSEQSRLILPEYVNRGYIEAFDYKTFAKTKKFSTTLQHYGSETITIIAKSKKANPDDITASDDISDALNAAGGLNFA